MKNSSVFRFFLPSRKKRFFYQRGFTLIVTISLLVLLMILAVAMLSLSSVSLRTSSTAMERGRAMANARTSLMLAIGELQRQAGLDTRVTARADILPDVADDFPPLLGVWRSWQGENHEQSGPYAGRPINPGDYLDAKRRRFLGWMVSGAPVVGNSSTPPPPPSLAPDTGKVPLIGPGTVGTGRINQEVHLSPTPFLQSGQRGAFAWWVGGENQKARVSDVLPPEPSSNATWSLRRKSTTTSDPSVFGLDALLTPPAVNTPAHTARLVSRNQCDLVATPTTSGLKNSQQFYHDLSAQSVGLLTNTATGGWRKDFSLATENWSSLGTRNLPFFQVSPGNHLGYSRPTTSDYRPDRSLIFPWSGYRGNAGTMPIYEHGAVASWANLQNWATLYKTMSPNANMVSMSSFSASIGPINPDPRFNFHHRVRILPVVARVQWVFSWFASDPPATTPPAPAGHLQPRLLVTPVVTMWNPYNVRLSSPNLQLNFYHTLPNAFRFRIGTQQNTRYYSLHQCVNYPALMNNANPSMQMNLPTQSFFPGETRVFSPINPTPDAAGTPITLGLGLRMRSGFSYPIFDDQGQHPTIPGSTALSADVIFDSTYNDAGSLGVGVYLDMNNQDDPEPDKRHLAYRMVYDPAVARQTYPQINGLASASLSEARSNPRPFLTTIFGARMASRTHLAAKGFVQTSPLVNYTAMGGKDTVEETIQHNYPGSAHPVNSPFDYSFAALSGAGDSLFPNADGSGRSFIVTGFTAADGLSRSVMAELPTRPVQSLAELQNWDMRYENPIPPYAFNLVGNSDASPLMPANQVIRSENYIKAQQDLQHDDSYCANHLLFDDWFVSSITPQAGTSFGRPQSAETLRQTYLDFISGIKPLPNTAYRPLLEDARAASAAGGPANLFTRHVSPANSWRTIASRLEVEGMFNVNSTSVTAWRALLGHARGQRIPFQSNFGSISLSNPQDFAFTRFSVSGDTDHNTRGNSGQFSSCSQFAGYRLLDAPTLDRFAQEIVNQVRRRGPFLSLAEFVNRQLSSGDLALAGTIQAALNTLAQSSSSNPFQVLQNGSRPSTANPPSTADAMYAFPAAANGFNAYGIAGWTRQADVLRPIAPILSARDDTFVIRAYGDARDASGTRIVARAICEAVVRRTREFVNPIDAADIVTTPTSPINQALGRRMQIISFRWLSPEEI
jgi:hypothetical protein